MPCLALEPSLYPSDLLDGFTSIGGGRNWWAVHTKPRQEKSLARQLIAKRVPIYLPLVARQTLTSGRRKTSHSPLFSSYVFVYADEQERIKTLETKRVVQMLAAPDPVEIEQDLRNLKTLVESGAALTVESQLAKGTLVRVRTGCLQGLEGMIISRRGQNRLLVAVRFFQQGASVLIDDFQVEPISVLSASHPVVPASQIERGPRLSYSITGTGNGSSLAGVGDSL